uniref:non-specific serine/threonine protein kinase n=1 Tax=Aegilops tauschii TaxID=37682 RepID=R7W972_AEGTA
MPDARCARSRGGTRRIQGRPQGAIEEAKPFADENAFESNSLKGAVLSSPLIEFSTVLSATNNFNDKLGAGGFGPVYKGRLPDGQEIAIKRLSNSSSQGSEEFKNEVTVLSKLQHRNLVRLFGCCVHGEEKMLVYEYMPNNSLDSFIFDETKRSVLGWKLRYNIIQGIGKGLLYLHQDSTLRIIHRDLKASNVLLDDDFIPKISDFGMARIFGEYQRQALTHRIVGTYGYIAPEYAMEGKFSEKSDVFSFGVLILEIVCGRRNSSLIDHEWSMNLVGHAWTLWQEGRPSELIDALMGTTYSKDEVWRCIQCFSKLIATASVFGMNLLVICEQINCDVWASRPCWAGVSCGIGMIIGMKVRNEGACKQAHECSVVQNYMHGMS